MSKESRFHCFKVFVKYCKIVLKNSLFIIHSLYKYFDPSQVIFADITLLGSFQLDRLNQWELTVILIFITLIRSVLSIFCMRNNMCIFSFVNCKFMPIAHFFVYIHLHLFNFYGIRTCWVNFQVCHLPFNVIYGILGLTDFFFWLTSNLLKLCHHCFFLCFYDKKCI